MCLPCRRQGRLLLVWDAESLELLPGFLKIIVDDDLIVHARCLGVLNLLLGLGQALLNGLFLVGGSAAQPLLQDLDRGRL